MDCSRRYGRPALGGLAVLVVACSSTTGLRTSQDILAHQAQWINQGITSYSYTYEFTAYISYAYRPLRLAVRQDTVRSVVDLTTGDSINPAGFPTINGLFAYAISAAQRGTLSHIEFDAVRGYPSLVTYAVVPDGLSSQQASALQPAP